MDDIKFNLIEIKISNKGTYSSTRYLNNAFRVDNNKILAISEGIQFEPSENEKKVVL